MGLPAKQTKSSVVSDRAKEVILECAARGMRPPEIAKLITKDKKRQKVWRARIWNVIKTDAKFQADLAARAQAEMALDLVPSVKRLGKRASRLGKPQEVKLLAEMSGFHNPRMQHEHSGEISIKLDIPRPARLSVDDDEITVDAEVVE